MPDSIINTAVAPEPLMKSIPLLLRLGIGVVKTEVCAGVITPMQLGPISVPPISFIISTICFSSFAPSSFSSLNPA